MILIEKVKEIIESYGLIKENDNILIGLSGGPDSMALLFCLLEIKKSISFNIVLAHVNHGVRGEDARADQVFVEKLAKDLDLAFYTKNVDMVAYGKEKGITAEEAGRELRYGFFREILKEIGGGKIAVAHNKNDQVETLLMRIIRGTGIDGLKGMTYRVDDIIRPILHIERREIEQFLKDRSIESVLDKTNLEPIYTRNKVRLELIPYLEENFNPKTIDSIWRLSNLASEDVDFLNEYTMDRINSIRVKSDGSKVVLSREKFLKDPKAIRQRVLRQAILEIKKSLQGISEVHIDNALELIGNGTGNKEIDLIDNIKIRISYDQIIIENKAKIKMESRPYSYGFSVPGTLIINNEFLFESQIIEVDNNFVIEKKDNTKYFDYDRIKGGLEIRNRKNGDRFVPFGMEGSKKLKDYLIDEKVPLDMRDNIPLLVDDENIIYVVGYRTSNIYRVRPETKRVLKVTVRRVALA